MFDCVNNTPSQKTFQYTYSIQTSYTNKGLTRLQSFNIFSLSAKQFCCQGNKKIAEAGAFVIIIGLPRSRKLKLRGKTNIKTRNCHTQCCHSEEGVLEEIPANTKQSH